jgi:AcrR family transcriptional regulator
MGRPSLADQRGEEILDAMTRCVARFGVEGTTLERLAAETGLSRPHIRHYVGNRDQMVDAFRERLVGRYITALKVVFDEATPGSRSAVLAAFIFGADWGPSEDNAAIDALLGAAARDERLRTGLRASYLTMERLLVKALRSDFPDAPPTDCASTAYAMVCLAFAHSTLAELSFPASRKRSVDAVVQQMFDRLRHVDGAGLPIRGRGTVRR